MIITITIIIHDYYILLPYVMVYYKLFPSPYGLSPESPSNITEPPAPYAKRRVLIKTLSLSLFVESPLFNIHDSPIPLLPASALDIVTNPKVMELHILLCLIFLNYQSMTHILLYYFRNQKSSSILINYLLQMNL